MKLEAIYDIPNGVYTDIVNAIKDHLKPRSEVAESVATRHELKPFRYSFSLLPTRDNSFPGYSIDWFFAGHYAQDLRLFPQVENVDRDILDERYRVPLFPGTLSSYKLEIFGKNVNGFGDYPMTMRLKGDFSGFMDHLAILESWHEVFKEQGFQGMIDKIIALRIKLKSLDGADRFAHVPKTEEEFEEKIRKEKQVINFGMLLWSIGATRFWWDFFGKPVKDIGFVPKSLKTQMDSEHMLLFSEQDLEIITKYPSLPKEEIIGKVFPKPQDDFTPLQ